MSRRGLRLSALLAEFVALLFAGRWFSALCADRWWAAEVSPASVDFLTDWHFLKLILDLTGVVLASAWFIGHFLVVYRAVGSVQVRRNVANLEIRGALTPGALLGVATSSGLALGLLVGVGTSRLTPQVALAWQGVSYGELDPLLQRDFGLYVAQLPVWRAAHGFFFLLEGLGLGTVFGLYLLVGAVRWIESRPAINTHARVHLGVAAGRFCARAHVGIPPRALRAAGGPRRSARPGAVEGGHLDGSSPGGCRDGDGSPVGRLGSSRAPRPRCGGMDRLSGSLTGGTLDGASGDVRRRRMR